MVLSPTIRRPFAVSVAEGELRTSSRERRIRSRLRTLWILVSGLWTIATLLRIHRVWVPLVGWHRVIEGPWIWIGLAIPPTIFALIVGAINRILTRK